MADADPPKKPLMQFISKTSDEWRQEADAYAQSVVHTDALSAWLAIMEGEFGGRDTPFATELEQLLELAGQFYDPAERAREKQAARDADWRAWKSGEKTAEEIRRANSWLSDKIIAESKISVTRQIAEEHDRRKQASRDADAEDIAAGRRTATQVSEDNLFVQPHWQPDWDKIPL